jgi:hypothetical protein
LAVEVLTALGERDPAVRNAERRAGAALWPMTAEEGLPVCEAVDPALYFTGDPLVRPIALPALPKSRRGSNGSYESMPYGLGSCPDLSVRPDDLR